MRLIWFIIHLTIFQMRDFIWKYKHFISMPRENGLKTYLYKFSLNFYSYTIGTNGVGSNA